MTQVWVRVRGGESPPKKYTNEKAIWKVHHQITKHVFLESYYYLNSS